MLTIGLVFRFTFGSRGNNHALHNIRWSNVECHTGNRDFDVDRRDHERGQGHGRMNESSNVCAVPANTHPKNNRLATFNLDSHGSTK